MKTTSTICVLAILLPAPAIAEPEVVCAEDWPTRCAVEIKAGDKARFAGQLMTPDMAIYLGQSASSCEDRTSIEVTRTASIAEADAQRDARIAAADKRVVEVERDAYKEAASRPFYEHPIVVSIVTAAVLISLFVVVKKTDRATE